jgi:uncharacterized protein
MSIDSAAPNHDAATQLPVVFSLRNATPADFPQILNLNEASVRFLSPLTPARLALLHAEAAYHRVLHVNDEIAAFLMAFREGAAYDSVNYQWFSAHYERFLYIDRVVVSTLHQGRGLGARLYADLFAFAKTAAAVRVTCEFDIDPPNEISRRFHARHGFAEVGTQAVAGGAKRVSLQAAAL